MASIDLISLAAVLLMFGGLVAVLWEILAKDPGSLFEMMEDSRRFAEVPAAEGTPPAKRKQAQTPANLNDPRLAA
ncbi:MAG: hypothetical protein BroJett029_11410 [Alphaproteobacteria bacterium]|nr:MAG: hypothetical protein BroJett029_11410 [Alphaproteobacteria bacterium]